MLPTAAHEVCFCAIAVSGKDERVDAAWILNCTGPWADRICQRSSVRTSKPMLGGVRGSHIVLPRFSGAPTRLSIPRRQTAVRSSFCPGTTRSWSAPPRWPTLAIRRRTVPSNEEIEYLLRTVTNLFPKAKLSAHDIKYAFAGIRPLPNSPGNKPSAVTRRHFLHDHADDGAAKLISVIGGKLTTAASLARECARKIGISRSLSRNPSPWARQLRSIRMLDHEVLDIARAGSVSEETARGMMEWHGPRAIDIARMALVSAELRAPICPHTSHIVAEVVEAYRKEFAVTLGDVLLRRVPVALGACWSESCSREAALRIGAVLGWNDQDLGANLESFEMERSAFLRRPARHTVRPGRSRRLTSCSTPQRTSGRDRPRVSRPPRCLALHRLAVTKDRNYP